MLAGRAVLALLMIGILSSGETALAQANGDPGSMMLGIARAKEHAEARTGRGIERWRQQVNAWQGLQKLRRRLL